MQCNENMFCCLVTLSGGMCRAWSDCYSCSWTSWLIHVVSILMTASRILNIFYFYCSTCQIFKEYLHKRINFSPCYEVHHTSLPKNTFPSSTFCWSSMYFLQHQQSKQNNNIILTFSPGTVRGSTPSSLVWVQRIPPLHCTLQHWTRS